MNSAQLISLALAASVGAMVFFSAVVTPLLFRTLSVEGAGTFLRAVFPTYFMVHGAIALCGGLLLADGVVSAVLVLAGAAMLVVRFVVIPVINSARDEMLAGDTRAKATFDRWHRGAVAVNIAEIVAILCVLPLLRW